jgi:hypothetical protein
MRVALLVLTMVLGLGFAVCHRAKWETVSTSGSNFLAPSTSLTAKKPDFATEIQPIFKARCQPCHFQGGKVYDRLPFDRPETITKLGTKLFTRIKDEKEQRLIREFLVAP